jgi:N-acetylneuraminate synthase/N,N'-diacetyllegionaminate synthase
LLVSTGAATIDEVRQTVGWLDDWAVPFALLHCVSSYPTASGDANLGWIIQLREELNALVGFSDHTTEPISGALAVAAGAVIIEKHLTYDRGAPGPDHAASFDPAQFTEYVRMIRQAESMRGVGPKRVLAIEADVRRVSRQSVVAARTLAAGTRLSADDLTVQRPGTGISAARLEELVGRVIARPLAAGEMLGWDVLAVAA